MYNEGKIYIVSGLITIDYWVSQDLHTWDLPFAHIRAFVVIYACGICKHQDMRGYLHTWDFHSPQYSWLFMQVGFAYTRISVVVCACGICTHQDIRGYLRKWDLHTPGHP